MSKGADGRRPSCLTCEPPPAQERPRALAGQLNDGMSRKTRQVWPDAVVDVAEAGYCPSPGTAWGAKVSRVAARTRSPFTRRGAGSPNAPPGAPRDSVPGRLPRHDRRGAAPARRVRLVGALASFEISRRMSGRPAVPRIPVAERSTTDYRRERLAATQQPSGGRRRGARCPSIGTRPSETTAASPAPPANLPASWPGS